MSVWRHGWDRFQQRPQRRSQPARSPIPGHQHPQISQFQLALAPGRSCSQISAYRVAERLSIGNLPGCPKKEESRALSCSAELVWHCQTVRTSHPSRRNLRLFRLSFERFRSSFGNQNSGRDFGGWPIRHPWACQKHPFTKMTFRRDGNTMSGVPGSSFRCNRYLYPRAWRNPRTTISGAVFFPPMRDISALLLSTVLLSAMVRNTQTQAKKALIALSFSQSKGAHFAGRKGEPLSAVIGAYLF
jgi:hypothetical protein